MHRESKRIFEGHMAILDARSRDGDPGTHLLTQPHNPTAIFLRTGEVLIQTGVKLLALEALEQKMSDLRAGDVFTRLFFSSHYRSLRSRRRVQVDARRLPRIVHAQVIYAGLNRSINAGVRLISVPKVPRLLSVILAADTAFPKRVNHLP